MRSGKAFFALEQFEARGEPKKDVREQALKWGFKAGKISRSPLATTPRNCASMCVERMDVRKEFLVIFSLARIDQSWPASTPGAGHAKWKLGASRGHSLI